MEEERKKEREDPGAADIYSGNDAVVLVTLVDVRANPTVKDIGGEPGQGSVGVGLGGAAEVRPLGGIDACDADRDLRGRAYHA